MEKRKWPTFVLFAVIAAAVYFVNVEVQTWLGEKALAESGLTIHSLDEAMAIAQKKGENGPLILADLSAIWCPTCRKLDKTVLSDKGVQEVINKGFIFARVEYESDEGEAFKERYGLSGFPNLLILDAQGELIRILTLDFDPKAFTNQLLTVQVGDLRSE